ncbi:MAG: pseudouridine synthase [Patescibacteria group bacterium]
MRINKYLAGQGYATRRGGDELVRAGRVTINGRRAQIGDQINDGDQVVVKPTAHPVKYLYFAYHKPAGIISHSPAEGETDIKTAVGRSDIFPVGRLDKNSRGLIVLTNDGRITERLLHPRFEHEKEYAVVVASDLAASFRRQMERGVIFDKQKTKPCRVQITGERTFNIILTEGRKNQIRRMVATLGNRVTDLKRVRIMNLKLDRLPAGTTRPITGPELTKFLKEIGL